MADEEIVSLADIQTGFNTGYSGSYPGTYSGNREKQDSGAGGFTRPTPPPKKNELNFEVGVPYYLPWSTPYKNSWEVFKTETITIRQLEAMRRDDPQARALYRLVTMPIRAALKTSTISPIENVEGGVDEAAFIDLMFHAPRNSGGMVIPFSRLIAQMLLAVFHGFAGFELVYWVPDYGPLKGKITLRKASYRPPDTVIFLTDDNGEFDGWRQRTFFRGHTVDVKIPGEHCIYYACNEEENIFYGVSLFESAFRSYDSKAKLQYLANIAAQRGAVGTRVGTMPPNPAAADKDGFIKALSQLGLVPYIIVPSSDWTVESLKETTNFDFLGMINYYNSQMSKSILAQWFDEDQGGGNSSVQLDFSRQDDSLFIMMLETIMHDIEEVINQQLIPRFIDWNFGTGKYPTFKFGAFTDEQKAAIQATFNMVATSPNTQNLSPEFIHALERKVAEQIGLPIDYDTIQAEWDQEIAQNKEIQQLNIKLQMDQLAHPEKYGKVPGAPASGGPGQPNAGNPNPPAPPKQSSPYPPGGKTPGVTKPASDKTNKPNTKKPGS